MINKIYKLYDNLTNEQKLKVINELANHFKMSKNGIRNNWMYNKAIRHIPEHKQPKVLEIIKTY